MFDSDELDHELDRLIDGEPVEERDSLVGAAKAISALNAIKPEKHRRDELKNMFLSKAVELSETKVAEKSTSIVDTVKKWRVLSTQKVAAIALAILMSSGTTVYAASGSMPDSSLYSVKRTTEKVVLFIVPSSIRSKIEMKLTRERKKEISYMLTKGKSAKTRKVIEKLMNDVRDARKRSDTPGEKIELQNQINQLEKEVGATFKKHASPIKTNNKKNDDSQAHGEKFRKKDEETSTDKGVNKVSGRNSSNTTHINRGSSALDKNNARNP